MMVPEASSDIAIRTNLGPGDIGSIVYMHGTIYAREFGFNSRFEAYVAGPLAEFVLKNSPKERLWIAERGGEIVGCVAIVAAAEKIAQLRWFLVDPAARGGGLGSKLLDQAVAFCREVGYTSVILWTVSALGGAARLYQRAGFRKIEEYPSNDWAVSVLEEKFELRLD
jgi:N-acetylglutamate synthase-like GNAT family acetyltransferase